MILVSIFIAVFASTVYGQRPHELNIRENDKLCSQWITLNGGSISLQVIPSIQCIGIIQFEMTNDSTVGRACCQVYPLTTPSSVFPRECGKQQYEPSKQRIVGGVHARPNSWPWQVRLHANGGLCGGTLIDAKHVLTAAHCFRPPIVVENYVVYVGLHDIDHPVYDEQMIPAEKIFLHESYNDDRNENDVAVIRLSKPVTISDKINVICLPGPEANSANDTVWITGWGTTSWQGQASPVLKQTTVQIMPDGCSTPYSNYDNTKQICAGAHGGGRDTCQGDSGGPLMYESNGQWFLNGIVSYGFQCALEGYPGVYARVSYYLQWILGKLLEP